MKAARAPRADRASARLLYISVAARRIEDRSARDLPALLSPRDLLVVNDAATLPASLFGSADGHPIELRLVGARPDGAWRAVLMGSGDWHTPTEHRPPPPLLAEGARLQFRELQSEITAVSPESPRLIDVRFESTRDALWRALYRAGHPVQYSYVDRPLALWDVQTAYGARPWAVEAPSAGYPLTGEILLGLRRRGVALATITHAAGLSSTGDTQLDALLPLEERFEVPTATVEAIARADRVIAAGTTVVRALEACALQNGGVLRPGEGATTLHIGPGFRRLIVDGLLTGVHEPSASHYALLEAFATRALLDAARERAEVLGYQAHEFGDASLIL